MSLSARSRAPARALLCVVLVALVALVAAGLLCALAQELDHCGLCAAVEAREAASHVALEVPVALLRDEVQRLLCGAAVMPAGQGGVWV